MRINITNKDIIKILSELSESTGKSPTALIYKLLREQNNILSLAQNKDANDHGKERTQNRNIF